LNKCRILPACGVNCVQGDPVSEKYKVLENHLRKFCFFSACRDILPVTAI
jgi:hypothetical protein